MASSALAMRCPATTTCAASTARAATPLRFAPLAPRHTARQTAVVVRAEASEQPSGLAQFSANIGMPTDEGTFGFTPFAEQLVGRLSMLGFVFSIVGEFGSGKGTLAQIGMATPDTGLCVGICSATLSAVLIATFVTINDARIGKLSPAQVRRYAGVLGLKSPKQEKAEIAATQAALRMTSDKSADSSTAADGFLKLDASPAADAAAAAMKSEAAPVAGLKGEAEQAAEAAATLKAAAAEPTAAPAPEPFVLYDEASEIAFAKNIELTNGRWAMLGFWIAIVVEAATGHGIILQLIDWCKYAGLLGVDSGF